MYRWMILLSILLVDVLLIGCASSGGGAPYQDTDHVPPVVSGFAVTPPTRGWRGGDFTVEMHATDNIHIGSVYARVTGPYAGDSAITMSLISGSTDLYRGTGQAPANTNSNGTANTYHVAAWAVDDDGNSTTVDQSLSFTVPAPDGPLPPPGEW
ncbi:MAG: hypothetical protein ACYDBB_06530 [Armatimonadota bacterium]